MDDIAIKEEKEDNSDAGHESHNTSSSSSTSYSNPIYSKSLSTSITSITVPPTQRVIPSTLSASRQRLNTLGNGRYYASDMLHKEQSFGSNFSGQKRKSAELDPSRFKHAWTQPSLLSPPMPSGPLYHPHNPNSNLSTIPRYSQSGASTPPDSGGSQEDEWKNIKVMLNCISGMVKKTQRAIIILQQRQAEVANVRMAEELVAEVESKASMAIMEVKQAALEEIKKAKCKQRSEIQNDCKEKCCWNCRRQATETCSGCSLAKYCSPFCQQKDWEDHARVCREDLTMGDISSKQRAEEASTKARKEAVKWSEEQRQGQVWNR